MTDVCYDLVSYFDIAEVESKVKATSRAYVKRNVFTFESLKDFAKQINANKGRFAISKGMKVVKNEMFGISEGQIDILWIFNHLSPKLEPSAVEKFCDEWLFPYIPTVFPFMTQDTPKLRRQYQLLAINSALALDELFKLQVQ
jgi:hypothetical protein